MGVTAAIATAVAAIGTTAYTMRRADKAEDAAKASARREKKRLSDQAALSAQSIEFRKRKERQRVLGGTGLQDTILTSGLTGASTSLSGARKASLGE